MQNQNHMVMFCIMSDNCEIEGNKT